MELKLQLVKRDVAGETILVPIGDATLKIKGLITLNETASVLWDALPHAENVAQLADVLENEFEADRKTLLQDAENFLESMRGLGIIQA